MCFADLAKAAKLQHCEFQICEGITKADADTLRAMRPGIEVVVPRLDGRRRSREAAEMRASFAVLSMLSLASMAGAQKLASEPLRMGVTMRRDGGLGGELQLADGTWREFFLEVSATRVRLAATSAPRRADPGLAIGSVEEIELLELLKAWAKARFAADEAAALLAPERLPDPRNQVQDVEHRQQSLLRDLRTYEEVTRARFTKVFAGRGTVSLSMQVQLADAAPRQVLWRRLGDAPFARLHFDTEVEPLPMEGRDERKLLLAIALWLAERVGGAERTWDIDPAALPEDVRLVLDAYRGYLTATSPRLRWSAVLVDAPGGGSLVFELSDERNRTSRVRFDHAANTPTPGRMVDASRTLVIELGSAEETMLLATLRRAVQLRRAGIVTGVGEPEDVERLEKELANYEATFHTPAQAK